MRGRAKRRLFYAGHILAPLLLGALLYLLFRSEAAFAGGFVRNFAADMLWAYALAFALMAVLGYSRARLCGAGLLCVGLGALTELLQRLGVFRGTFDLLDILLEAAAALAALLLIKNYEEKRHEKNS